MEKVVNEIMQINDLIESKNTGSPAELAKRFNFSERKVKGLIRSMRKCLGCPIQFNHARQSYVYTKAGRVKIGFEEDKSELIINAIANVLRGENLM